MKRGFAAPPTQPDNPGHRRECNRPNRLRIGHVSIQDQRIQEKRGLDRRRPGAGLAGCLAAFALLATCSSGANANPSFEEKEKAISEALAKNPNDPAPLIDRAQLHHDNENWDAAAATYFLAKEKGADRTRTNVGLAQVFLGAEMPLAAQTLAKAELERDDTNVGARVILAESLAALGDHASAAAELKKSLALVASPSPEFVLRVFHAQITANQTDSALEVADAGTTKIGVVASIQLPAIALERKLGRPQAALSRIERLVAQAPRHPGWLAERGDLLMELGRSDEAMESYRRALAMIHERPTGRRTDALVNLQHQLQTKLETPTGKEKGS